MRRVAALLGLALVLVVPAGRADDANRECDNEQDITVVVDFKSLGGGVNVRCAPQPVKNGFDAFRRAGISYETVNNSDFVCRIANRPGPEVEDCANTPPGNAYWSYWTATRGGEWKYQNYGPGTRKPPAGSVEGWAFVTDERGPPGYPVPQRITEAETTTTAAAPAPPPTEARPRGPGSTATTSGGGGVPPATTSVAVAVAADTTTTAGPTTTTTSVALGSVDLSQDGGDGGTSVGFILSSLAIVSLGVLGFAFARRRAMP